VSGARDKRGRARREDAGSERRPRRLGEGVGVKAAELLLRNIASHPARRSYRSTGASAVGGQGRWDVGALDLERQGLVMLVSDAGGVLAVLTPRGCAKVGLVVGGPWPCEVFNDAMAKARAKWGAGWSNLTETARRSAVMLELAPLLVAHHAEAPEADDTAANMAAALELALRARMDS
jgi:hypothetical protein